MTNSDRAVVHALLRSDLTSFIQRCFQTVVPGQQFLPNWHIEAMAHQLERCRCGEIQRLIITLPPRNLKSISASVAFPAFVLGHDPSARIVCASYSQELAAKHARDCRTVMESPWYRGLFPGTRIDPRKNSEGEFETTAKGYRMASSVGGTLTGRGGNLIVIDDPLKPGDRMSEVKRTAVNDWYDSTLASRLDRKTEDAIIIVMQRLHVDDLVGHILERGHGWVHLKLPAIAERDRAVPIDDEYEYLLEAGEPLHPEREPIEVLEDLKATMGSQAFSAQYLQAPVPAGGALIRDEWFRYCRQPPTPTPEDRVFQSWDTASQAGPTNDYSVCTTWLIRGQDYYLLDVLRKRLEFPHLVRAVRAQARAYSPMGILIEKAGTGISLIQSLRQEESGLRPIAIRPEGDKITRLEGQSAVFEAGRVVLPEEAPWLDDYRDELLAFPHGRYDDQVDSTSQFLAWASRSRLARGRKPRVFTIPNVWAARRGRSLEDLLP